MSGAARKIHHLLKTEPQDDTGLRIDAIAGKLNMPALEVSRAGDELLGAGVIFTTMDDQTWAILEY